MLRIKYALILVFLCTVLLAQNEAVLNEATLPKGNVADLSTPRTTIETHLKFLQADNYLPEVAAKTMPISDKKKAEVLAQKLKQILDAEGLYVDMDVVPDNPEYVDTVTGLSRYVLFQNFPQIYVERINGKWYYSKRTTEAIPVLHDVVFPLGSDLFVNMFPSIGQKEVFGLKVWQLLGLLILIVVSVIVHKLLTVILDQLINRGAKRYTHLEGQVDLIHNISKPLSIMFITLLLVVFVPSLMLPIKVAKFVITALNILTPIFGTLAMYKLMDLVGHYMSRMADKTDTTLDDQLVPLVRKSLKIFVVVIGALVVLQNLNVNVTTLLAGISIGGLAFALAAQDTIKNLFGSLMIFVDRPFQIGDWITFDGKDGTVEEVGFRSTRVRTFANSLISVPNGRIADMTIDNMGLRVYRRFSTSITITYDTPPALIEAFVEGLREIVKQHPDTRKDQYHIYVNNLGAHSIDILFYIFFAVPEWGGELQGKHQIIMSIIELAETLGVRFAFPTQTFHIEDLPGQNTLSPKYETDPEVMKQKLAAFLEGKKQA